MAIPSQIRFDIRVFHMFTPFPFFTSSNTTGSKSIRLLWLTLYNVIVDATRSKTLNDSRNTSMYTVYIRILRVNVA